MTDKERENREELFRLMRENPDLPVLPMVQNEVVGGDDYARWIGSFGKAEIREYLIDEWYGDGCVRYRGRDDEDTIIEGCAVIKYDGSEAAYEKAKEEVSKLWTKAIVVNIDLPE